MSALQYTITKKMKSNPKQPSCKKCVAPKKTIVKKMWNPRWWPRNGWDGRLIMVYNQCQNLWWLCRQCAINWARFCGFWLGAEFIHCYRYFILCVYFIIYPCSCTAAFHGSCTILMADIILCALLTYPSSWFFVKVTVRFLVNITFVVNYMRTPPASINRACRHCCYWLCECIVIHH